MKINTKADWIYLREVLGSKEADKILARLEEFNVHWTNDLEARNAVAGAKGRQYAEYLEKAVPGGYEVLDLSSHNWRPDSWAVLVAGTLSTREEAVLAAQEHAKRLSDPVADDEPVIDPLDRCRIVTGNEHPSNPEDVADAARVWVAGDIVKPTKPCSCGGKTFRMHNVYVTIGETPADEQQEVWWVCIKCHRAFDFKNDFDDGSLSRARTEGGS